MIVQLVSVMVARVSRSSEDGSVAAEPHAAPGASAASVALGASLRGARENRGLSVQQVAAQTRIPRRHLESLECGDLDAVPAGPYRRGEVLAFAHTVGMDRDEALRQLAHALAPVDVPRIEPTRQVPARVGTMSGWLMVATLALVAVGAVFAWFRYGAAEVPEVAPRGSFLTTFARRDLYGDALNETLLMRPGQWLTRFAVFFDNRGVDGLVNGLAATIGGTSGRLRRIQTGYVRSYALSILFGAAVVVGALLYVGNM